MLVEKQFLDVVKSYVPGLNGEINVYTVFILIELATNSKKQIFLKLLDLDLLGYTEGHV